MKTNVMRYLDQAGIKYRAYQVQGAEDPTHGEDVAQNLGFPANQVFKTLVTENADGKKHYVFMIPVAETLDLKAAAKAAGEKKLRMLPAKRLLPLTGYVHGGCSPLGMKTQLPTFVDEEVLNWETMVFNGGQVGSQVQLSLSDLQDLIPLDLAAVTSK